MSNHALNRDDGAYLPDFEFLNFNDLSQETMQTYISIYNTHKWREAQIETKRLINALGSSQILTWFKW
jgi:hypothetical protein